MNLRIPLLLLVVLSGLQLAELKQSLAQPAPASAVSAVPDIHRVIIDWESSTGVMIPTAVRAEIVESVLAFPRSGEGNREMLNALVRSYLFELRDGPKEASAANQMSTRDVIALPFSLFMRAVATSTDPRALASMEASFHLGASKGSLIGAFSGSSSGWGSPWSKIVGYLKCSTNDPKGGIIRIDGKTRGRTEKEFVLTEGQHSVTIELPEKRCVETVKIAQIDLVEIRCNLP